MIRAVELFAGVGGFRVGLNHIKEFDKITNLAIENGKYSFVFANQFEPATKTQSAYECYIKRFDKDSCSNLDISLVDKKSIPDHDLLVGGFPCQDYSVARSLKDESGIKGKKGVLFWDIKDAILAKKPPFVLLENVDRLLKSPSTRRGRDFAIMLKTFNDLGYNVEWRVINAGSYSMPQRRKRVFIFAFKKSSHYSKKLKKDAQFLEQNTLFNSVFKIKATGFNQKSLAEYKDIVDISDNYKQGAFSEYGVMIDEVCYELSFKEKKEREFTLQDILNLSSEHNQNLDSYIIKNKNLDKWKYLKGAKKIERTRKDGSRYFYSEGAIAFPDDLEKPARTMLTSEGTTNRSSHIIYDKKIKNYRILTEIETELIQMFPPNWTNSGMSSRQRYFMMGNALVTGILSKLEPRLSEIILNS
ncbi:MAG: DNA (cytosine-5-)-methyltransferase [Campylobacteraceae bacterium]|nr:DNA (cytosine-5-)-methyltransferase [Campylobacteraceae bacterium]